jgi:hypothetical protein
MDMDLQIVTAAQKLFPGTSWNYANGKLIQADDGSPRVTPPTMAQLQPFLDAASKSVPVTTAQQIAALQAQVASLLKAVPSAVVAPASNAQ